MQAFRKAVRPLAFAIAPKKRRPSGRRANPRHRRLSRRSWRSATRGRDASSQRVFSRRVNATVKNHARAAHGCRICTRPAQHFCPCGLGSRCNMQGVESFKRQLDRMNPCPQTNPFPSSHRWFSPGPMTGRAQLSSSAKPRRLSRPACIRWCCSMTTTHRWSSW